MRTGFVLLTCAMLMAPGCPATGETAASPANDAAVRAVLDQIADARATTESRVDQLAGQLAAAKDPSLQAALCRALGATRDRGAIEPLIKHLTLSVQVDTEKPSAWGGRPAVEGLASIGIPALPRLAEVIRESDDAETRHSAALAVALALVGVDDYREAQKMAQTYLALKADAATQGTQRERLLQAAKLFEGRSFIAPMPKSRRAEIGGHQGRQEDQSVEDQGIRVRGHP